jgi:hypothetical protein
LASAKNFGANNFGARRASQHGKDDEDVFEETHARHIHPPVAPVCWFGLQPAALTEQLFHSARGLTRQALTRRTKAHGVQAKREFRLYAVNYWNFSRRPGLPSQRQ